MSMATARKESDEVVALSLFMLLLLCWFKIFKRYEIAGLSLSWCSCACLGANLLFVYPPHLPRTIFYNLSCLRDFKITYDPEGFAFQIAYCGSVFATWRKRH